MVKLFATAPLLSSPLKTPQLQDRYFKEEAFLGGKDFLYQNDADGILFRTRMATATVTLLLAVIVFDIEGKLASIATTPERGT